MFSFLFFWIFRLKKKFFSFCFFCFFCFVFFSLFSFSDLRSDPNFSKKKISLEFLHAEARVIRVPTGSGNDQIESSFAKAKLPSRLKRAKPQGTYLYNLLLNVRIMQLKYPKPSKGLDRLFKRPPPPHIPPLAPIPLPPTITDPPPPSTKSAVLSGKKAAQRGARAIHPPQSHTGHDQGETSAKPAEFACPFECGRSYKTMQKLESHMSSGHPDLFKFQ